MMKLKLIGIVFAVLCTLVQLIAREPLRVGIDVPEPKLIKKVEITYPGHAKSPNTAGPVVLDILIDEEGRVADVTERSYTPPFLETTKSAVKAWRFSPTFVAGKAVPVTATVVVVFSLWGTPVTADLGFKGVLLPLPAGNQCFTRVLMDRDGNLTELPNDVSNDQFCKPENRWKLLIPQPDVPFSLVEEKIKGWTSSIRGNLLASQFSFPDFVPSLKHVRPGVRRLYYSVLLVDDGSQLVQLAGVDPNVQPPKFDIDFSRLAESLNVSEYRSGDIFFCAVFVDENGTILGIEDRAFDKTSAIVEALSKSRAITPGFRNGVHVPTAVILAIRVP